jgi:hypothetical protein
MTLPEPGWYPDPSGGWELGTLAGLLGFCGVAMQRRGDGGWRHRHHRATQEGNP